jgi:hypothetical protein
MRGILRPARNLIYCFIVLMFYCFIVPQDVEAIYDPLSVENNKFGIHIITPSHEESSPAAALVNTNGDWGYVTFVIEGKDKNHSKWQKFFDDLRRRHLIPIVRIATYPENEAWKKPDLDEARVWADFLDSLNWPVKNRYVIIYNEPNHANEWGGSVDAKGYAKVLDAAITALKNKNQDFFVLNAGLDASAPQKLPAYQDEINFLTDMDQAVPGIFEKLDGWVSHSYPNPGFVGDPDDAGRGTVRTWYWELQTLRKLGVKKDLPVFITETGWKHAEGINYDHSLPDAEQVALHYKDAFDNAWNQSRIVAVTPFLLNYQEAPFDHFSFKKITGEGQKDRLQVLAAEYPEYYPSYLTLQKLPKSAGKPVQDTKAQLVSGEVYQSVVGGESYAIPFVFRNTGQSIWGEGEGISLTALEGAQELGITTVNMEPGVKIEPGQEYTFIVNLKAPNSGRFPVTLSLFQGSNQLLSAPLIYFTEVKTPVSLYIKGGLKWKNDSTGDYNLHIKSFLGNRNQAVHLDADGNSQPVEARFIIPDYTFGFTLEKPFYKSKTITQRIVSGVNTLDFGQLEPDFSTILTNPSQLWELLPFSN